MSNLSLKKEIQAFLSKNRMFEDDVNNIMTRLQSATCRGEDLNVLSDLFFKIKRQYSAISRVIAGLNRRNARDH